MFVTAQNDANLVPIAAVPTGVEGYGREEGRANARLIATAPELLSELADAVKTLRALGLRGEEFDRKEALIARATTGDTP